MELDRIGHMGHIVIWVIWVKYEYYRADVINPLIGVQTIYAYITPMTPCHPHLCCVSDRQGINPYDLYDQYDPI
jgi:hypothetical protein